MINLEMKTLRLREIWNELPEALFTDSQWSCDSKDGAPDSTESWCLNPGLWEYILPSVLFYHLHNGLVLPALKFSLRLCTQKPRRHCRAENSFLIEMPRAFVSIQSENKKHQRSFKQRKFNRGDWLLTWWKGWEANFQRNGEATQRLVRARSCYSFWSGGTPREGSSVRAGSQSIQ